MLSAYVTEYSGSSSVVNTNVTPKPLGAFLGVIDAGDRKASVNECDCIYVRNRVVYGNIVWNTSLADVKLLGSTSKAKTDTKWDYDAGPGNAAYFYPTNQFFEAKTAELQFVSNSDTPFSNFLEWTSGLYYFESKAGFDPFFLGVYRLQAPGPIGDVFSTLFNGLSALGLNVPAPSGLASLAERGVLDTDAIAGYAQAKWSPADWVSLTLGGRFQKEHREVVKSSIAVALDGTNPDATLQAVNFLAFGDYEANKSDFSPRVALDFDLPGETLVYASWSQAYKSGTFNIINLYTPPKYVRPEKTSTYELGIKGHTFDGTMRYTAAVFDNKIEDLQTQTVSLLAGGAVSLANAASATIYGAEFDINWQVLPEAAPGLALILNGGYLHGEYDDFPEGSGFDEISGIYFGPGGVLPSRDFSGHETVRTPKYSGSVGLSYGFSAPGGSAEIGGDVYFNSGYFYDTQNVVDQPKYQTVNVRMSYLYEPWDLRISVFGKNITSELYYYNLFATDFGVNGTAAPGATYGITLSWSLLH